MMSYRVLEGKIVAWAKDQNDIQSLVVIGSRARFDHPANEWSDLDLILFSTNPQRYVEDASWLAQFGTIWLQVHKITGIGDPEWLVLYDGGLKVDFLLANVTGSLNQILFGPKYGFVTRRGLRMLLDKGEGSDLGRNKSSISQSWERPDEKTFTAVINQFWLSAYRATNILLSSELWRAKMIVDNELRSLLLRIFEWQAKAVKGNEYDTWHDGRFLEEWIDPRFKEKLPLLFAPYDQVETSRALLQTIDMGSKLGKETAGIWHYHYPVTNTRHVHDWIVMSLTSL